MLSGVEAQKERGKRMCGQLIELLHIATIGVGLGTLDSEQELQGQDGEQ
jgi:hypothetical protein